MHDAEDLLQDALVKTFARRRATPSCAARSAYLRRAICTLYLDRWRSRKRWAGRLPCRCRGRRDGRAGVLTGAGFAPADESTEQAPDGDRVQRVHATFRGHGYTIRIDGGNDTGGGWLATWQVTADGRPGTDPFG